MTVLFELVGGLSSLIVVVMTIVAAFSLRKPRKISALTMLISGIVAFLALLVMVLIGGLSVNPVLALPAMVLGTLFGLIRGQLVKFNLVNQQVIGRNSILFIILWGFSLGLSLLLGLLGFPLMASLGLLPVVFSTGLQIGYYLNLFLRRIVIHLMDHKTLSDNQAKSAKMLNLKTYTNPPVWYAHQKTVGTKK